jgi:hypothetical protein
MMLEEFVALEIIVEVFGRESAPIDHTPFYYGPAEKGSGGVFCPPDRRCGKGLSYR